MFPCKYLYSTRALDELFARRIIKQIHGKHISEIEPYLDPDSKAYREMLVLMEKDLNVTSLRYQRLEDMIKCTGLDEESLCTYCWTGREVDRCVRK
jgi:amidophosphoribosyltransferase